MLIVYNKDFEKLKQNYNAIKKRSIGQIDIVQINNYRTRNFTLKRMFEKGLKICKIEDGM